MASEGLGGGIYSRGVRYSELRGYRESVYYLSDVFSVVRVYLFDFYDYLWGGDYIDEEIEG